MAWLLYQQRRIRTRDSVQPQSALGGQVNVIIYEPNPTSKRALDVLRELSDKLGIRPTQERREASWARGLERLAHLLHRHG